MKRYGVSEVARSPRGFLTSFKAAGGDLNRMGSDPKFGEDWRHRRENFIARHMGQINSRGEALWDGREPSRRHLALIAWAYTPDPQGVARWLKARARSNPLPNWQYAMKVEDVLTFPPTREEPYGLAGGAHKAAGVPQLTREEIHTARTIAWANKRLKKYKVEIGTEPLGHGSFGYVFPLFDLRTGYLAPFVAKITGDANEVAVAAELARNQIGLHSKRVRAFPWVKAAYCGAPGGACVIIREDLNTKVEDLPASFQPEKLEEYFEALGSCRTRLFRTAVYIKLKESPGGRRSQT